MSPPRASLAASGHDWSRASTRAPGATTRARARAAARAAGADRLRAPRSSPPRRPGTRPSSRRLRRAHPPHPTRHSSRAPKSGCTPSPDPGGGAVVPPMRPLEPVNAEQFEHSRTLRRCRDVPPRLAVSRHPPALIRVDHDLEVGAHRVPHDLDDGDVVTPIGVMEADLHGADPAVP